MANQEHGEEDSKGLESKFKDLNKTFEEQARILIRDTGLGLDEAAELVRPMETALQFAAKNPSTESLIMANGVLRMMNQTILSVLRLEAARHEADQNLELAHETEKKLAIAELRIDHYKGEAEKHKDDAERHRRISQTDALTGKPNRYALYAQLDYALEAHGTPIIEGDRADESNKRNQYYALVALDLDRLKSINDLEGHPGGDAAIKAAADILSKIARHDEGDRLGGHGSVARLGGDEFTLILETYADSQEEAEENFKFILPKVQERLEGQSFDFNSHTYPLVMGAGMHVIQKGDDAATIYELADKALDDSKRDLTAKQARYEKTFKMLEEAGKPNLRGLETREAIEAREETLGARVEESQRIYVGTTNFKDPDTQP